MKSTHQYTNPIFNASSSHSLKVLSSSAQGLSSSALVTSPPSLPLILIGPGTGCAPFRGFVEERTIKSLNCSRTAPVMFFFGCRNKDKDFLYKDFRLSHSENGGILSEAKGGGFYVAFSRDDRSHKVYVQHTMREYSKRVYDLLRHRGAVVYVAGSSTKMPADVLSIFEEIRVAFHKNQQ